MRAAYLVDWNDFVSHTVNHYKQWVKNWEVENEPNAGFQYQDYAEILKESYQTIKAGDPTATVAGFSGGGFTQSWYDSIINLIGTSYFDAMSVHLYNDDPTIHQAFGNYIVSKNKPGWNTETGLTGNHFLQTLLTYDDVAYSNGWQQNMEGNWSETRTAINNYLLSMSEGRMSHYFYYFNRFTNAGPTQPTRRGGGGKEMVEYDGSLRPDGVGLSIASSFIDGTTYNSKYVRTSMNAYLYMKTGGVNGFFWLTSGSFHTPAAGSTGSDVTYYDLMGNPLAQNSDYNPNGGPIYFTTSLTNISTIQTQRLGQLVLNTSTNAAPVALLSQVPASVQPGTPITVLVSGHDMDQDGQSIASYEVSVNGNVISEAPTSAGLYTFTAPTTQGTYSVSLRAQDDEGTWSPAVTTNFTVDNTYVWNGGGDKVHWSDPMNWAPHSVPGSTNNAIISVPGALSVHLDTSATIGNLQLDKTLSITAGSHSVLRVSSLTLGSGAALDLNDNAMIVDYTDASPLSAVSAMLTSGFNGGSWNGAGIMSSSAAAVAGTSSKTAVGITEASNTGTTSFQGQPVDATTLLIRYTLAGDSTLDGGVNALDFNALATNFGQSGKFWFHGDFNYDGTVNTFDFTLLGTNFGKTLPALAESLNAVAQSTQVAALPTPNRVAWTDQSRSSWSGWSDWSASAIQQEMGEDAPFAVPIEAATKDLLTSL